MFFRSECFKTTTLKKIQLPHDHDQDGPFERRPLIFSVSKVHHNTYQTQRVYSICQYICFTLDIFVRIHNITNDTCLQWGTISESLEHLFVKCGEVQGGRAVPS
jgi:hypothetical protein